MSLRDRRIEDGTGPGWAENHHSDAIVGILSGITGQMACAMILRSRSDTPSLGTALHSQDDPECRYNASRRRGSDPRIPSKLNKGFYWNSLQPFSAC